ncbi:MAG TPA: ABC transporter substrate-binding protein [Symbiobacteriaceae bacterium]|nr:ABC transporter substrate-binding protein [Symbiobacteriaceae bacterium]
MRSWTRGIAAVLAVVVLALAGCTGSGSQKNVELNFYFPIAVGGPLQAKVDAMVTEFTTANPNIKVTAVYAGNYQDTMTKVQAAKPEVAVLQATDIFTLTDLDLIVPIDDFVKKDKDGEAYMADMVPAFMGNSKLNNKTWSVPFQRSTVVMYYNKDLFKAAGLDPNKAPANWTELVDFGKKLTKTDGSQWGLEIPSDGNPYWTLSSLFYQQGAKMNNEAGTTVSFNSAEVAAGMEFFLALSKTHKIMPTGVIKWGDVPNDFIAGKAAMIFHTTGSIGAIKGKLDPAKFGVAPLPAGKSFGSPTGGGNLYILKSTKEKQEAAWKFVRFLTDTNRVAQWSADTGYIPYRKSAMEAKPWKDAVAGFAGYKAAADALQHAQPELATHNNQQVLKAMGDQLQAIITGSKDVKTALEQAQKDADAILKPFQK